MVNPPRMLATKATHPLYVTVSVCSECNNGWMSSLESEALPILAPLISGETDRVELAEAAILMRWAAKVMVAYERDDPASAMASLEQIRDVRTGQVPRWMELWAARNADPAKRLLRHTAFRGHATSTMLPVTEGSRTFIGLGHIVLLVHAVSSANIPVSVIAPDAPWRRVWPPSPEGLVLATDPLSADDIRDADKGIALVDVRYTAN